MAIALKVLLLSIAAVAQNYGTTPPHAAPSAEELREHSGLERVVPYFTAFVKTIVGSWVALESTVLFILSDHCPPALARPLQHALLGPSLSPASLTALTTPTPAFIVGTLLSVSGALLRAHAYRVLGPRFTFELSIRRGPSSTSSLTSASASAPADAHALVTDGVYSVVRHPSYTGGAAIALGYLLCLLDRRGTTVATVLTCLSRCHHGFGFGNDGLDATTVTALLACAWATATAGLLTGVQARMNKEDAMLEKHFGEAWRAWAKRVPWRLIPGIY